jgi:hypothetical protein
MAPEINAAEPWPSGRESAVGRVVVYASKRVRAK